MATKKYVSLSKLSDFLDNLKNVFAYKIHTHTVSDISDYVVDSQLSSTSSNPVENKVIDAEFNAISDAMGALEVAIDTYHEELNNYYTKSEIDAMVLITVDDIDMICGSVI